MYAKISSAFESMRQSINQLVSQSVSQSVENRSNIVSYRYHLKITSEQVEILTEVNVGHNCEI